MKLQQYLFLMSLLSLMGLSWPPIPNSSTTSWLQKEMSIIQFHAPNIDSNVLRLSLIAFQKAQRLGLDKKQLLTVIDYSKPSSQKRLWVFNLKTGETLFNTWVTHGKNSGGVNATSFSNQTGSLKSSIGIFLTTNTYMGKNGLSLKMNGLERGVNDNANSRAIVFHGARYVNTDTINKYGQIGRSWGCPAVSISLAKSLINTIKENTLVFAYYPDRTWLAHSTFLTG